MIHFDISKLKIELSELEKQTSEDGFWSDSSKSSTVLSKIKSLKTKCTTYSKLENELKNLAELTELVTLESDEQMAKEIIKNTIAIQAEFDKFELSTLLSGKYDKNNAIVTLHPGAGGTESQDWAEMLYRMYTRWAIKNGFQVQELDI